MNPTGANLIEALDAIAGTLDGKRNRFGKLETFPSAASERLRQMLLKLGAKHGGRDKINQAVYVARALVAQERGLPKPEAPQ